MLLPSLANCSLSLCTDLCSAFYTYVRCFLVESKLTGVYINLLRSRQLHVIYCDYFITFIQRWCTRRFYLWKIISSPTWPVLCCSVMSDLDLDNPGYRSLGAPPPAPPSSDYAADRRTCLTCHGWLSMKTFDRHTLYFLPWFCL